MSLCEEPPDGLLRSQETFPTWDWWNCTWEMSTWLNVGRHAGLLMGTFPEGKVCEVLWGEAIRGGRGLVATGGEHWRPHEGCGGLGSACPGGVVRMRFLQALCQWGEAEQGRCCWWSQGAV